jgi:hypothetical protein
MLKPSELPSWSSELWHLYLHGLAIFLRGNIAPNVQCKASAHILWLPISLGSRFNTPQFRTQDVGKLRGTLWVVKFHILLDSCSRVRRKRHVHEDMSVHRIAIQRILDRASKTIVLFDTGLREIFASLRQPIRCGKTALLLIETLDIQVEVV